MQPTFLPPPNKQPQGNNFMNFQNGAPHHQGSDPGLSNQFANIDLNSSSSGHGVPPSNIAPLSGDPHKFPSNAPPSSLGSNYYYNNVSPAQKQPSNVFPPPTSVPNSFLSNASAPSPLPSNLLGNHPPNYSSANSHPTQGQPMVGKTNNSSFEMPLNSNAGPANNFNQNSSVQQNQNQQQSKQMSLGHPGDFHQSTRKSSSPQQPDGNYGNGLNSSDPSPISQAPTPPTLSRPPQSYTPRQSGHTPDSAPAPANLQSPDASSISAFKPSSGGPFQPLKPQTGESHTGYKPPQSPAGNTVPTSTSSFQPPKGVTEESLSSPQSPSQPQQSPQSFGGSHSKPDDFPPSNPLSGTDLTNSAGGGDASYPSQGARQGSNSFAAPTSISSPSQVPASTGFPPSSGLQSPEQPPRQQQYQPQSLQGLNQYPSASSSARGGPPSRFGGPQPTLGGPSNAPPSGFSGPPNGPPSGFGGPPNEPPSELRGPPNAPSSGFGGPSNGPPSGFGGPPNSPPSGFGGPPNGPPSGFGGPPNGPPSGFGGPPNGPPSGFGGPPNGPPSGFGGPPNGPPLGFGGPPNGPPSGFGGPQSNLAGPPLNGPTSSSKGPPPSFGSPPMNRPPSGFGSPSNGLPTGGQPSNFGGLSSRPPSNLGGPQMSGPPSNLTGPPTALGGPPLGSPPPSGPPLTGAGGPTSRPNLSRPQYARPPPQASSQPGGFPQPSQQPGGFPPQSSQQQSGFPPQPSNQGGFPPQASQQAGFPPQQPLQQAGFPQQQPSFPPQNAGIPPSQQGFPPQFPQQQPGFPQAQGGFPPMSQGGPPQQKYPPQQVPPGYPPQPATQGYPPRAQPGYPQGPGGYDQQQQQNQEYSGMQYPNTRPQPPPQKKLDPDNMPSRIQVMEDDRKTRSGEFRTDQRGGLPPLVTTPFTVQDQGNCSPRFVRATMYSVPVTADLMKQVSVPLGLVLSPLARVSEGETEPPEADFSQCGGPVRCARCKAYMAPFMQFVDGGRRFHCPMCKASTEVPETYFAHMDALGQRMDKYQRPELCLGSYELIVSEQYCRDSKFPNPPALIFLLDVSYNNVKSGLVSLLCSHMMEILGEVTNERLRVGFITYASSVQFYNIKSSLMKPELLEVTDVHDMFMPLLEGFLGSVEEAGAAMGALMGQIPALFEDTKQTETLLLPAIQAGLEALKANDTTGKLLVFNSSLPILDAPGKLANREDRKMLGTDKEKTVLTPQNTLYNSLAQDCVNSGVSVDLFVFNNAYVDLATVGQVARLTGGQVYKYTYFQASVDGHRLLEDLRRNLTRPTAYDAVMRVRTSTGIRPTDFYGHMFMSNTTDMEFASMDSEKAVAVELKHDDKLVPEEGVIIQVAFLYTSAYGVRKVRVHNLSLNATSQMADLYRYCELDSLMNFLAKQCAAKLCDTSPRGLREALVSKTATILATYRKHCASPGSSLGQLILPECLKLLPLYVNSLLRCDALSGGPEISLDDRSFALYSASVMDIPSSVVYLYPHLISLHDIDPDSDELPRQERCSFEKLQPDGAYLLDNSIYMFLWIGQNISPQWVESVFGVPSPAHIDTDQPRLPELNNALNRRVADIIDYVRSTRPRSMRLTVVRQKDKLEVVLRQFLIEDRGYTESQMSYVDFLCHIHKEIRNQLS